MTRRSFLVGALVSGSLGAGVGRHLAAEPPRSTAADSIQVAPAVLMAGEAIDAYGNVVSRPALWLIEITAASPAPLRRWIVSLSPGDVAPGALTRELVARLAADRRGAGRPRSRIGSAVADTLGCRFFTVAARFTGAGAGAAASSAGAPSSGARSLHAGLFQLRATLYADSAGFPDPAWISVFDANGMVLFSRPLPVKR